MNHTSVHTDGAPRAIGSYSQATVVDMGSAGRLVYTAGQIALDPQTMQVVEGGIGEQVHQVIRNLTAILVGAGAAWENVVKTTIFLVDMNDFAVVNQIYSEVVSDPMPARSTVQVAGLPMNVLVEIELVAFVQA
jgi:2-iminobutanoate/2-iminopropanoate deaminase